jgi:hypothetical protein
MTDSNQPAVDETPISPSRPYPERKNSLEKHLSNRPSPDELRQSMSFPLQYMHLSKLGRTTNLVCAENILPNSTAAPALQAQQKELEKHMRVDSLNEKIAHRPSPEELRQSAF